MARQKDGTLVTQGSFDFFVAPGTSEQATNCHEGEPLSQNDSLALDVVSARVLRIEDYYRVRHVELVRRLLADTGVFHVPES